MTKFDVSAVSHGLDPKPLRHQVALITGATGGLGQNLVKEFATAGASIVLHHFNDLGVASRMATALEEAGVKVLVVEADMSQWGQVEKMYAEVTREFGRLDILVNNAGMMRRDTFADMTLDQWNQTIDVDLTGVFIATRLAMPLLSQSKQANIVNMASQLAFKGAHEYVPYSAAKSAIVGFTRALAREIGPKIRVNAIAPGPIETAMTKDIATPEWVAERTSGAVLQRLGTPDEVAPSAVFLCTPGAQLFHGQTLQLNGGGVMA